MEGVDSSFCFQTITHKKIKELITNLDTKKAAQSTEIPTKLVIYFVI